MPQGARAWAEALQLRLLADLWSTSGMIWEKGITFPCFKQSYLGMLLHGNLGEEIEGINQHMSWGSSWQGLACTLAISGEQNSAQVTSDVFCTHNKHRDPDTESVLELE